MTENINTPRDAVNGAAMELHSILVSSDEDWHRITTAKLGDVVELAAAPTCVCVRLINANPDDWPSLLHEDTVDDEGTVTTHVVIPLKLSNRGIQISIPGLREVADRDHVTASTFPYELGFAITYHKVQGRTIARVILDITPWTGRSISLAGFFVGYSRVCRSTHLRFWPTSMPDRLKALKRLGNC